MSEATSGNDLAAFTAAPRVSLRLPGLRRQENKSEGCGTPADAYGMSHATRTNVAIRPRFGRGAALKRRPLTCRRSATALTAANQRRRSAPDALPGTRLRSRCCLPPPVPVQRQSRRPVMMPAGRIPEAAREQDVSSHPREPHPPPRRRHPRGEVLRERMISKVTLIEYRKKVKYSLRYGDIVRLPVEERFRGHVRRGLSDRRPQARLRRRVRQHGAFSMRRRLPVAICSGCPRDHGPASCYADNE